MDSIQAQLQIRQNAMEAQEYAQDLLSWQSSIKAKAGNSSRQQQQQHPRQMPVRGRASGSVAAAPQAPQQPLQDSSKQSHPAAHTYKNYDKWDKFDVDAALAATEAAEQQQQPALPRPAAPPAQQQQQQESMMEPRVANAPAVPQTPAGKAAALKDQGNKLFQAQYYDDAISCYSQSIDAQPTAVAYANRAMAFLKLSKPLEAEADCSAALQLDPSYVKAWHRRGSARRQLGKLLDAAADFEEVLRLEPSNAPVQADRNTVLDQHLKQAQIQRSTAWHSIPVKRQQHQHQQAATGGVQPVQEVSAGSAQQQQQDKQQGSPTAAAPNGVARPVTPVSGPGSKSSSAQASPQQRQSVAAAAQAAAEQLAARLASSLKAPKTGHEFEAAWRSLKGDVALQAKYLRLLQPQLLPALFKSSLTAQLLSSLMTAALSAMATPTAAAAAAAGDADAAQDQLSAAQAVGLLEGLVSVPRFEMMVMSLGSRDKAALKQVWEVAAAAVDSGLQTRLAAVRPKYRV